MTRFHSHNQYSDTWHKNHNILCDINRASLDEAHNRFSQICDLIGVAVVFGAGYCALSYGAILDMIVAGGQ